MTQLTVPENRYHNLLDMESLYFNTILSNIKRIAKQYIVDNGLTNSLTREQWEEMCKYVTHNINEIFPNTDSVSKNGSQLMLFLNGDYRYINIFN